MVENENVGGGLRRRKKEETAAGGGEEGKNRSVEEGRNPPQLGRKKEETAAGGGLVGGGRWAVFNLMSRWPRLRWAVFPWFCLFIKYELIL